MIKNEFEEIDKEVCNMIRIVDEIDFCLPTIKCYKCELIRECECVYINGIDFCMIQNKERYTRIITVCPICKKVVRKIGLKTHMRIHKHDKNTC